MLLEVKAEYVSGSGGAGGLNRTQGDATGGLADGQGDQSLAVAGDAMQGSCARREERPESDVDLLVKCNERRWTPCLD